MKNCLFVFILAFIGHLSLLAQPDFRKGYVIDIKGDTLFGEIDFRSESRMGSTCTFRENEAADKKQFTPGDITAYRFTNGKYYVAKQWNENKVFLEFLINGQLDVYYLRDDTGNHYFIEKAGLELVELPYEDKMVEKDGKMMLRVSTRHRGILTYYMQDAPTLSTKIMLLKEPEHKNMIQLAKSYHNIVCDGDKCIVYEKQLPTFKMNLEPTIGLLPLFDNFKTFHAGVATHIWMPRENEHLNFKTGLQYAKVADSKGIDSKLWQIPLILEYVFNTKRSIQPHIGYGINACHITNTYRADNWTNPTAETGLTIKLSESLAWTVNLTANFMPLTLKTESETKSDRTIFILPGKFWFMNLSTGVSIML